jgi:hypothetical protein
VNHQKTELLRSALAMAGRGWHVFPCVPGSKEPALRGNWQRHATTDPAQICAWWTRRPYNVGISCGPSGLVVIDLDVPKASDASNDDGTVPPTGAASLARLCQQHGEPYPSATFTVSTPSGGSHLYFTATSHIRNSASSLGPLIDIRATGGYVLAPGSQVGGRPYAPRNSALPAPLPRWIATALRKQLEVPAPRIPALPDPVGPRGSAYAMAALRAETHRMATATDGTRHDTLNKAAFNLGQLVGAGLLPEPAVITSLADAARQSGLPERDIPRIIRSGMTAGTRHPRVPRQRPSQPGPGTHRPPHSREAPTNPIPPQPSLLDIHSGRTD